MRTPTVEGFTLGRPVGGGGCVDQRDHTAGVGAGGQDQASNPARLAHVGAQDYARAPAGAVAGASEAGLPTSPPTGLSRNRPPVRPYRAATISAMIATAISAGERP